MIKRYVKRGRKTIELENGKKIRKQRGKKVGVLVADLNEQGKVVIGHSKWHKKLDEYDPKFGSGVAMDRLKSDSKAPPALSILSDYLKFKERVTKYFKSDVSDNTKTAIEAAFAKKEKADEKMAQIRELQKTFKNKKLKTLAAYKALDG